MIKKIHILFVSILIFQSFFSSAGPVVSYSGSLINAGLKIEVLADSNSALSINDALYAVGYAAPAGKITNLSTDFPYWIRLTISNNTANSNLAIHIPQPLIDYIDFYQVRGNTVSAPVYGGHRMPAANRPVNHQTFIYPVSLQQGETLTCYWRVKVSSQNLFTVYVGSAQQVFETAANRDILFGIYVGIILVMIFYNLFVYFSIRERSYIYYVSYLLIVLLTQVSLEGYAYRFFLGDYPAAANLNIYIMSSLIGLAAIEYSKNFLNSRVNTPRLSKVSYVFWVAYALCVVLAFSGKYAMSYQVIMLCAMTSAVYVLYMAIRTLMKGSRSARFFLIAWSVFIGCVVVFVLSGLGVVPYNTLTGAALLIGSAFEAVMLSFALADKINILKKEKDASQAAALFAAQENERIIRDQNIVLEAKVSERTAELKTANGELSTALDNLKEAQTQLVESEKMASLGQLTAGIAHEINNPINFVTSNVKPLKRDIGIIIDAMNQLETLALTSLPEAEKQKKIADLKTEIEYDYLMEEINFLLTGISDGSERTAEIVKGLRVFSRVDEDDLKKVDIHEGINSSVVIVNTLLTDKIKIVKHYGDLPLVECYAGKLNQVFLNIISNGIHAVQKQHGNKHGGLIEITTERDRDNVHIKIKDNGTGMDDQTAKKIFEPFFTTKNVGEGTGLGLSIVYNIIRKHNGTIVVNSSPGNGAEFVITIPIIQN